MSIYLDYNSSAPIDPRVLESMIDIYKNTYGNADSRTHNYGVNARKIVENARLQIANLTGCRKDEVFFTSGSTESNNIAVLGLQSYAKTSGKKHIITSSIEHKAILHTVRSLQKDGFQVDLINPGVDGRIRVEDVLSKVSANTLFVSIMHVNNETGIIQPVKEIGDALHETDILFHTDATQSAGKLVDEIRDLHYDIMTFSAHKMSGPQGIGALILRKKRYKLPPVKAIMYGGEQEHSIRPGTLPVALIAGFGKACEIAGAEYKLHHKACQKIKETLIQMLNHSGLIYKINGNHSYAVPNTINFSLKDISSEALMLASRQYCGISNGSACNSQEYKPSYVLTAMGIPSDEIEHSLRISWGPSVDLKTFRSEFSKLLDVAKSLVL